MKYASTALEGTVEKVVVILDLTQVSNFDPLNPTSNAYGVDDSVQLGWIKNSAGTFEPPPPVQPTTTGTVDA